MNRSIPSRHDAALKSSTSEGAEEWVNRRATEQATRAATARQSSGRRRFIDPTTCDRDYSAAEMEFMTAMNEYKRSSGRMFPTWSEVLEVLKSLGYEKVEAGRPEPFLAPAVPARPRPNYPAGPAVVPTSPPLP
jgi:hypothetical protein